MYVLIIGMFSRLPDRPISSRHCAISVGDFIIIKFVFNRMLLLKCNADQLIRGIMYRFLFTVNGRLRRRCYSIQLIKDWKPFCDDETVILF